MIRAPVCSQVLAGVGLSSGAVVGALLAEDMLESKRWAGITSAPFTVGAAGTSLLIGQLSQRGGRRHGLASAMPSALSAHSGSWPRSCWTTPFCC